MNNTNRFDLPDWIYTRLHEKGAKEYAEYSHYEVIHLILEEGASTPATAVSNHELLEKLFKPTCEKSDAAKKELVGSRLRDLRDWNILDRDVDFSYHNHYVADPLGTQPVPDGDGVPALHLSTIPDVLAALPLTSKYGRLGIYSFFGSGLFVCAAIVSLYVFSSLTVVLGLLTMAWAALSAAFVLSGFGILATVSRSDPAEWFLPDSVWRR